FPLEVTHHVMLDLIEAARLPPTRTAFSTELIDRSGVVRPDEPDVRTAGRTEPPHATEQPRPAVGEAAASRDAGDSAGHQCAPPGIPVGTLVLDVLRVH